MSPQAEMKILNLHRGQPIKKAEYALELMKQYTREKELLLRIRLNGIKIG